MTTKQLNLLRVSLDLVPGAFQFIPKRRNHSENVGTRSFISQPFHFGTIANLRTILKNLGTISNINYSEISQPLRTWEPLRTSEFFYEWRAITLHYRSKKCVSGLWFVAAAL